MLKINRYISSFLPNTQEHGYTNKESIMNRYKVGDSIVFRSDTSGPLKHSGTIESIALMGNAFMYSIDAGDDWFPIVKENDIRIAPWN